MVKCRRIRHVERALVLCFGKTSGLGGMEKVSLRGSSDDETEDSVVSSRQTKTWRIFLGMP